MDKIALLSESERAELFSETARLMNTTNAIVEKDFWVVWVLSKIFSCDAINKKLMFKGGTSLSKVFNLIGRFSEDIDLILDWREVVDVDPNEPKPSKTKQDKFNKQVNECAKTYIKEELLPLASWLPHGSYEISSYAYDKFSHIFDKGTCSVNAICAERTFWEKATILHQEANRPENKDLPPRYSRHYYDLAIMAKSDVKQSALKDLELLSNVVDFKNKFYPNNWAKYDDVKEGLLKLLPNEQRISELKKDYQNMQNMIFAKNLTFEDILETLHELETDANLAIKG